jgi:hypothetical protein
MLKREWSPVKSRCLLSNGCEEFEWNRCQELLVPWALSEKRNKAIYRGYLVGSMKREGTAEDGGGGIIVKYAPILLIWVRNYRKSGYLV